ncbi:MAG TPA: sigma-54 dependent transcriptional regulator [Longimicrobiales bacterium]|nr:sigma-54 dependent transcriptional regulator [Longimicrobiales bacterium]
MSLPKLLIADDERPVAEGLKLLLAEEGYETDMATNGEEAWDKIASGDFGLVLADLNMPKLSGLELFARMRQEAVSSEIIIITGEGTVASAVEAMREGAYDYLTKPLDLDRLKALIPKALETYEVKNANKALRRQLEGLNRFGDMVGQSDEMLEVFATIEAVAPSQASVLIIGESGTGKELVARAMHEKSPRRKGAFVALNCGAFPREILENELFGHEKGAFTGAVAEKAGAFELADGGTLFLDEVAEMEPDVQVKFLRALEQRAFRRLGGKKEVSVDIRVIAATNRDVQEALDGGDLREDLYHRLAVIPMTLPPLRDRGNDVMLLAEEFLRKFAESHDRENLKGFDAAALEYLATYSWPGNVRELRNAVERAVILARAETISARDLHPRHAALNERELRVEVGTSEEEAIRLLTLKTYALCGGDVDKTATILGVPAKEVSARLTEYVGASASGSAASGGSGASTKKSSTPKSKKKGSSAQSAEKDASGKTKKSASSRSGGKKSTKGKK